MSLGDVRQCLGGLEASAEAVEKLKREAGNAVSISFKDDGKVEVSVAGFLEPAAEAAIAAAMPEAERGELAERAKEYRAEIHPKLSAAERRQEFVAPALMAWTQGEFVFAETDTFMETFDWLILDTSAALSEDEFAIRNSAMEFEVDIDGRKIKYSFLNEQDRLALDTPVEGWDEINLSVWLDRQVRQIDILPGEMLRWLREMVTHLTKSRGIKMSALWRAKYPLAQKIALKIKAARDAARTKSYQLHLFSPEAKTEISFDQGFQFFANMYDGVRKHRGGAFGFGKHFLGPDNIPAFSGVEGDQGEEYTCAQMLDSLPEVEFWIRNVARHDSSFRLPLAGGFFYPDFVAKLKDGRIFVVEYKGALLAGDGNENTNEKRMIGELWERASNGKGLFAVIEKDIGGKNMRQQMIDKITAK